jgi:hypothetical protein
MRGSMGRERSGAWLRRSTRVSKPFSIKFVCCYDICGPSLVHVIPPFMPIFLPRESTPALPPRVLSVKVIRLTMHAWPLTETKDARRTPTTSSSEQDTLLARTPQSDSDDMTRLKRQFSRNHAMTIHLNAIAMIATVWYGISLASRIQIAA